MVKTDPIKDFEKPLENQSPFGNQRYYLYVTTIKTRKGKEKKEADLNIQTSISTRFYFPKVHIINVSRS